MPAAFSAVFAAVEAFLEHERAQVPPWFTAAFGAGIAAWLWIPDRSGWSAAILLGLGLAAVGAAIGTRRIGGALQFGGLAFAAGCTLIWWRSEHVAAPRLDRPRVAAFEARVDRYEMRAAKGDVRLTLVTATQGLPRLVRISVPDEDVAIGLGIGARIRVRARLQPPPPMALPGSHDFARDLWFQGIGAVGRAIGPVEVIEPSPGGGLDALRERLGRHIRGQLRDRAGGIATALATGDQSAVGDEDAEAMRRSGLAHLLSVSGLHIAAVISAAMLLTLKLLALSERLALRFNLVLVAAGAGALAGLGYTLLTGMQVPTVRACIAALLVLGGIALGRDAISLRLVAVGALAVLLIRPEALAGASFQMSFAAVTSIIALHHWEPVRKMFGPRDESRFSRILRGAVGLLLTGLVVELALIPFALHHFHRAGLYGVAANLIAIPLTTFVVMPLEALALILDPLGLSAPIWTATGWSIDAMLVLAHRVGEAEGAVAMLPTMPSWAFALMIGGGLWLTLWSGPVRRWGLLPFAMGALGAAMAPVPDILITGDGRHLALIRDDGVPVLLRSRTGDFVRDLMSEASAYDGDPLSLEEQGFARCSRDACVADIVRHGTVWRLLATRGRDRIDWAELTKACADADIVVADRRLPRGCSPRWLKLDRQSLEKNGGVVVFLDGSPRVSTVAERVARHPWRS
ncbi:ComEC family competence protein [Sphingomonas sp. RB56-2]|uniref:ComEC family competence protein n=1 Tax=Sphingomonas brevis TaxID=2908206 RepID=A0ABT0S6R0_9SPHN|nr:ComEC/Rec2 family competence protein [Sphingomonas brevis]MCL6740057.1 ComEC family competence protein [Sphingomonas brevis]